MIYTTISGDTWDMIAYKQLGDTAYTDKLMRLNSKYIGYYMALYLAGMTAIPYDMYEAARVDGASSVKVFFKRRGFL